MYWTAFMIIRRSVSTSHVWGMSASRSDLRTILSRARNSKSINRCYRKRECKPLRGRRHTRYEWNNRILNLATAHWSHLEDRVAIHDSLVVYNAALLYYFWLQEFIH